MRTVLTQTQLSAKQRANLKVWCGLAALSVGASINLHSAFVPAARAISIVPGNEAAAEVEADLYRGVGQLSFGGDAFCTGSLVSTSWFLTARHCSVSAGNLVSFGDDLSLPTENLLGSATVLNAFNLGAGSLLDGGDIELLQLSAPVTGIDPIALLNEVGADLLGLEAINVGWGLRGDGTDFVRPIEDATNSAAVRNVIDAYGQAIGDSGNPLSGSSNIFSMDFDEPGNPLASRTGDNLPIPFEGQVVIGDSGGPAMLQTSVGAAIAGVLSGGTTSPGNFGDVSWWTGLTPHFDWINHTIAAATPNECVTWTTLSGDLFIPCQVDPNPNPNPNPDPSPNPDPDPESVPEPSLLLGLLLLGGAWLRQRVQSLKPQH